MTKQSNKIERIHSLDSLRAIMMWLGVVLHSALAYTLTKENVSIIDMEARHISNDYILSFIHSFRMQLFFIVAGFFAALLFYARDPRRMIKNRVKRILLPFIVFSFALWPFSLFSWLYSSVALSGGEPDIIAILKRMKGVYLPYDTTHLWFLYYLSMITAISVILGFVFKKSPSAVNAISRAFEWVLVKPVLRIIIFTGLTSIVYFMMGQSSINNSLGWMPDLNTLLYYYFFYFVGWVLFKSKHLLETFMKFDWLFTLLGVALNAVYFNIKESLAFEAQVIVHSLVIWLLVFGITGLFIRYASKHSAYMRYISDSSYWVYLIHAPITVLIPGLIVSWPLNGPLKFLIVTIITTIITIVSYHYLVRSTFIGQFLNGKKYSRKISDIKKVNNVSVLKPDINNIYKK